MEIVRINEREDKKQSLQIRLSEASLCLGREVRLGGLENLENLGSPTPRHALLRLGVGVSG